MSTPPASSGQASSNKKDKGEQRIATAVLDLQAAMLNNQVIHAMCTKYATLKDLHGDKDALKLDLLRMLAFHRADT